MLPWHLRQTRFSCEIAGVSQFAQTLFLIAAMVFSFCVGREQDVGVTLTQSRENVSVTLILFPGRECLEQVRQFLASLDRKSVDRRPPLGRRETLSCDPPLHGARGDAQCPRQLRLPVLAVQQLAGPVQQL